jgi:glucuronate isomerase
METYQRLLGEIEQIPAIDVHSHISLDSPVASDLSQIALYHFISSELETAGVDPAIFDVESPKKKLARAAAGFASVRNTASCWCLEQILGDLFNLSLPHEITDIDNAFDCVQSLAGQPEWTREVLKRANVSKVLVCIDWRKPLSSNEDVFAPILRVDSLVNEAHSARTLDQLGKATGQSVYEVGELKKAISELLGSAKRQGAVAVGAAFEPQIDFVPGDRESAGSVLSLALLGQKITREDRKAIRSYVLDIVLNCCAEYELPFQLMLGVRHVQASDRAITGYESTSAAMYADLFRRHSETTFDVFVSDATICHELLVLARNYANVLLSGAWWYLQFPSSIRRILRDRIEMLPMTKSCTFISDAHCVEWVYGRARLVRKELALTLSQLVSEGYLSFETSLEIARNYLQDNPKRVYKI